MLVRRARDEGFVWEQIASSMNVSRQAVHKKHAAGLPMGVTQRVRSNDIMRQVLSDFGSASRPFAGGRRHVARLDTEWQSDAHADRAERQIWRASVLSRWIPRRRWRIHWGRTLR